MVTTVLVNFMAETMFDCVLNLMAVYFLTDLEEIALQNTRGNAFSLAALQKKITRRVGSNRSGNWHDHVFDPDYAGDYPRDDESGDGMDPLFNNKSVARYMELWSIECIEAQAQSPHIV